MVFKFNYSWQQENESEQFKSVMHFAFKCKISPFVIKADANFCHKDGGRKSRYMCGGSIHHTMLRLFAPKKRKMCTHSFVVCILLYRHRHHHHHQRHRREAGKLLLLFSTIYLPSFLSLSLSHFRNLVSLEFALCYLTWQFSFSLLVLPLFITLNFPSYRTLDGVYICCARLCVCVYAIHSHYLRILHVLFYCCRSFPLTTSIRGISLCCVEFSCCKTLRSFGFGDFFSCRIQIEFGGGIMGKIISSSRTQQKTLEQKNRQDFLSVKQEASRQTKRFLFDQMVFHFCN